MFWKTAKRTARQPAANQGGAGSITGRLVWLYMVSACGILILSSGFLYWTLAANLEQESRQFLADTIRVLRDILRDHPDDLKALEEEVLFEAVSRRYTKYYVRIFAQDKPRLETLRMTELLPPAVFPLPVDKHDSPEDGVKWRARNGRVYYLVAAMASVGHRKDTQELLQLALDVSHKDALLVNYRRQLALVLLIGMVVSGGAAVFVTRRGIRPLAEITAAARDVTATQLHERIGPVRWPRELTALATTFDTMLDRLEDSFTRLSQFSADLAHELRTPINNLMGEAETTLARARTPAVYQQVLESSLEEYARLSRLIDSLLFLARAESPETHIHCQPLNARKEIDTVREFYEVVAEEHGITVLCLGEALVQADPTLFPRAVSNLLANALQYTPPGGKIMLSIQEGEDHAVTIRVRDSGCGVAAEHLPKIFDRFYRVDSARSQHRPGMGLGLAIVQSIMTLHKGTVAIESALSQGTTITLHFPPAT